MNEPIDTVAPDAAEPTSEENELLEPFFEFLEEEGCPECGEIPDDPEVYTPSNIVLECGHSVDGTDWIETDESEYRLLRIGIRPIGFVIAGASLLTLLTIYAQGMPAESNKMTGGVLLEFILPGTVYAISAAMIWATISVLDDG